MKKIFTLLAIMAPVMTLAQQNIMKAWHTFETISAVKITGERHAIERDPENGNKTYHFEYWNFSVPKDGLKYIEQFAKAFERDAEKAYSVNEGVTTKNDEIQLAVGTGSNTATAFVGAKKGSHYKYCLFLDPDDAEGHRRYSYSLDWIESDGQYTGSFIITYATTLKYRQEMSQTNNSVFAPDISWFSRFMALASTIDRGSPTSRKYIAGQIFDLTKTASSQADKDTAIDVINSLLPNIENKDKDQVTATILRNCIKNLQQ